MEYHMNQGFVDILVNDYVDGLLYYPAILNGIRANLSLKKKELRLFRKTEKLIKTIGARRKKYAIVITESKTNGERILADLYEANIHPVFINMQFRSSAVPYSSLLPSALAWNCLMEAVLAEYPLPSVILGVNKDSSTDMDSMEAFNATMKKHDLEPVVIYNDENINGCLEEMMDKLPSFKNIFCVNDFLALLLLQKIKKAGINPDGFNISGAGNIEMGRFIQPPLTTTSWNPFGMGFMAVELYVLLSKGKFSGSLNAVIDSEVVLRGSTHLKLKKPDDFKIPKMTTSKKVDFYGDTEIHKMELVERMFKNCDEIDITILKTLQEGGTYEKMCDYLDMAINSVHYRIRKMLNNMEVQNKEQLIDEIKRFDVVFK
ncbi:MAG: substrate-binding domain-containing protein [Treponema sp.]|jgi:DNA-binding LacI/PurR family transcriptional regulator|nr:substrate-binding domain-containing protein [Treponema sp.]